MITAIAVYNEKHQTLDLSVPLFRFVPRTFSAGWRLSLGCVRVGIDWGSGVYGTLYWFDLTTCCMP